MFGIFAPSPHTAGVHSLELFRCFIMHHVRYSVPLVGTRDTTP